MLQLLDVALAAQVHPQPALAVAGVLARLALQRIGLIQLGIQLLDQGPQVGFDLIGDRLGIGKVLRHWEAAGADALLEVGELLLLLLRVADKPRLALRLTPVRITEIEEGPAGHLPVVEHPMENLQLSDAGAALVIPNPLQGLALKQLIGIVARLGRPAIALAQHPDEVGPAALDLRQADADHLSLLALLLRDAPAQVHIHHLHTALLGTAAQGREHLLHQQVALLHEIPEGAGEEHPDLAGLGSYGQCLDHGRNAATASRSQEIWDPLESS